MPAGPPMKFWVMKSLVTGADRAARDASSGSQGRWASSQSMSCWASGASCLREAAAPMASMSAAHRHALERLLANRARNAGVQEVRAREGGVPQPPALVTCRQALGGRLAQVLPDLALDVEERDADQLSNQRALVSVSGPASFTRAPKYEGSARIAPPPPPKLLGTFTTGSGTIVPIFVTTKGSQGGVEVSSHT